jgi:predicted site-specific integrase-resolvase
MIAAIYARVSTSDQKCDLQLTELREYSRRMDWKIVVECPAITPLAAWGRDSLPFAATM